MIDLTIGRWAFMPTAPYVQVGRIDAVHDKTIRWGLGSGAYAARGVCKIEEVVRTYDTEAEADAAYGRYRASLHWSLPVITAALDKVTEAQADYELVRANARKIAIEAAVGPPSSGALSQGTGCAGER